MGSCSPGSDCERKRPDLPGAVVQRRDGRVDYSIGGRRYHGQAALRRHRSQHRVGRHRRWCGRPAQRQLLLGELRQRPRRDADHLRLEHHDEHVDRCRGQLQASRAATGHRIVERRSRLRPQRERLCRQFDWDECRHRRYPGPPADDPANESAHPAQHHARHLRQSEFECVQRHRFRQRGQSLSRILHLK